jgi:hypothetical protein
MKAELDRVNGTPVLRLEATGRSRENGAKRAVFDLPLTPEQARTIGVHSQVLAR